MTVTVTPFIVIDDPARKHDYAIKSLKMTQR